MITNSTLTNNSAVGGAAGPGATGGKGLGGAVFERDGSLTVLNATISGNTAAQGGRGVYLLGDGSTAAATLTNTIIGQSDTNVTDFVAATINSGSTNTSGAGNIIGSQTGFGGSIVTSSDPMLGTLSNNGGPTKTMALSTGSPAIGTGTAFTTVANGIAPTDTSITLSSTTGLSPNTLIDIDGEVMLVTSVSGTTLDVVRGYSGTTAGSASAGDGVYLYLDQAGNSIAGTPSDIGALQFAGTSPTGAPTISSINPTAGTLYGGTSVTITGTNLQNATSVNFGLPRNHCQRHGYCYRCHYHPRRGRLDTTVTTVGWDTSAISQPADQYTFTGTLPTYSDTLARYRTLTIAMEVPSANANLSFTLSNGNYIISGGSGQDFDDPAGAGSIGVRQNQLDHHPQFGRYLHHRHARHRDEHLHHHRQLTPAALPPA